MSDVFRKMFPDVQLELSDLYLLEWFQISYLPGIREKAFAAILHAHPDIKRYMQLRYPPIAEYIEQVLTHPPADSEQELAQYTDQFLWTIADFLVYNKAPEAYEQLAFHDWDFAEVTDLVKLDGKVVIDAGSGTGRVALEAAETADLVMAVEPVANLRQFIRQKAQSRNLNNLYVIDGLNSYIPLPDDFADVLITSHALGWHLAEELPEFERVVKAGGMVIHCPGTAVRVKREEPTHLTLISEEWGYAFDTFEEADGLKRKYWKQVQG